MSKVIAPKQTPVSIRLSVDTMAVIINRAAKNHRSINGEIAFIIENQLLLDGFHVEKPT